MSKKTFRPLYDRILVRLDTAQDKTESGLYLPEVRQGRQQTGTIVSVGEGIWDPHVGRFQSPRVQKGERVLFNAFSGVPVESDGDKLLIIGERDILAVIE